MLAALCKRHQPRVLWVGDHFIQGRNANNEYEQQRWCMLASECPKVELLDLSGLYIKQSQFFKPLFEKTQLEGLRYLNLNKCSFTRTQMFEIVEMIGETKANDSLEMLDMSQNSCSKCNQDDSTFFKLMLAKLPKLKDFRFCYYAEEPSPDFFNLYFNFLGSKTSMKIAVLDATR